MEKLFPITSHLQTHYHFKLDCQKVDQHTGGKWLIHGTKHNNPLQNMRKMHKMFSIIFSSITIL